MLIVFMVPEPSQAQHPLPPLCAGLPFPGCWPLLLRRAVNTSKIKSCVFLPVFVFLHFRNAQCRTSAMQMIIELISASVSLSLLAVSQPFLAVGLRRLRLIPCARGGEPSRNPRCNRNPEAKWLTRGIHRPGKPTSPQPHHWLRTLAWVSVFAISEHSDFCSTGPGSRASLI